MATAYYIMGVLLVSVLGIIHCPDAVIIGTSIVWSAYMISDTIKEIKENKDKDK